MSQKVLYILLLATLFLSACENSDKEVNAWNSKAVQKDVAIKVVATLSQGGKVKAKLTAAQMIRRQADTITTEFPDRLHVDFYNDARVIETRLDAKYGKYYETIGKVYLRDSVKVVSAKGDTLLCKDLWWDQNKQRFYTDKLAQYRSPTAKFDGRDGLEAPQDLKTISFRKTAGKVKTEGGQIP